MIKFALFAGLLLTFAHTVLVQNFSRKTAFAGCARLGRGVSVRSGTHDEAVQFHTLAIELAAIR